MSRLNIEGLKEQPDHMLDHGGNNKSRCYLQSTAKPSPSPSFANTFLHNVTVVQ